MVGWKVHRLWCNGWIWPNAAALILQHRLPCGPHTSSIGVPALGFPCCRNSQSWKSPQLQIWPHHRSDTASQPSVFFSCWGTENSQIVPDQENMEGDQPVQLKPELHTAAIARIVCSPEHCPGETGLPLSVFQAVSEMSLTSTTFQSPELLIQCGFIWKETMQLHVVSGKVEV